MSLHNPKSNAPAVYIPCWLIQVKVTCLSLGAKILYGRLAQWSNSDGIVFRSGTKLAEEIGVSRRMIVAYLKELKDNKLIGTYLNEQGGNNHYIFYDHPWMHEKINKNLCYPDTPEKQKAPCTDASQGWEESFSPPEKNASHPPEKNASHINNKDKIERNVCVDASRRTPSHPQFIASLQNEFDEKFEDYELTIEELFESCQNHYKGKKEVNEQLFQRWIRNEQVTSYKKKEAPRKLNVYDRLGLTEDDRYLIADYKHMLHRPGIVLLSGDKLEQAKSIYEKLLATGEEF